MNGTIALRGTKNPAQNGTPEKLILHVHIWLNIFQQATHCNLSFENLDLSVEALQIDVIDGSDCLDPFHFSNLN